MFGLLSRFLLHLWNRICLYHHKGLELLPVSGVQEEQEDMCMTEKGNTTTKTVMYGI